MLRLWSCLTLWLRSCFALRLWRRLALLRLRCCLTLRLRSGLTRLLLWTGLTLRRLICFTRLRLWTGLALARLLSCLPLLLLLLLLLYISIGCPQRRWSFHVMIGSKRLVDGHAGRTAMICTGKLGAVGAGCMLILHLSAHRRSVRLIHRHPLRGPRRHMETTRSAVVTHMVVVRVHNDRAVVDVVHHSDIDVVDRAVVVEVSPAPVAALIAVAGVAKAVVDAAIVPDVLAPVARVKPVDVIRVAPVAGRPQCALVRSLNPCAGHPVIAVRRPGPVAGGPDIVVAGILRLIVVGQRRRRLVCRVFRLLSVARIIGRLIGRLIRSVALVGRRALLVAGCGRWTLLVAGCRSRRA